MLIKDCTHCGSYCFGVIDIGGAFGKDNAFYTKSICGADNGAGIPGVLDVIKEYVNAGEKITIGFLWKFTNK